MNASRYVAHTSILCLLTLLFAGFGLKLKAQQPTPTTISYEGQHVASIDIAGRPDLNLRELKKVITQPENGPYSGEKIEESRLALQKAGNFEGVQMEVNPISTGLQVLFVVRPAMYIGVFEFGEATKVFPYTRLLQVSSYPNQAPYSVSAVEDAESNLLDFFHQNGFFLATVEPKLETDAKHGVVNVLFQISLRRRAKFGNVVLTGASPEENQRLKSRLGSWRARLKAAAIRKGKPYSLQRLTSATNYLQGVLAKEHYLAAKVQLVSANYNSETNRADITFNIHQGRQIAIKIQGAHVWGRTEKKLIPVYQENTIDSDLVEEGQRNLVSYFQSKGYFDATVTSHIEKQPSSATITYEVTKGKKRKVGDVEFHGNQHFDDKDLQPYVTVKKGGFLSHGRFSEQMLRKSVKNLEALYRNAGYSQVKVTPKVNNREDKLYVAFQVDEGTQDVVESLKIEGANSVSQSDFAPGGLNLEQGKPYSQQLLEKDRDQIMAAYLKRGYLTANFKSTARPVKQDLHHVEVVYTIYEGPQVKTSNVAILGAHHTNAGLISRTAKIPDGQSLSESKLLESESKLYGLGVFDWANVDPQQPIINQTDSEVLIKVHEAKRNNLTYGVGFEVINRGGNVPSGTVALPNLPPVGLPASFKTSQQTFWGPRGSFEYSRLDFLGRAETFTIGGLAARLDQRAAISLTDPSFLNSIWSSTTTISAERTTENPIFTEGLTQIGFQVQRSLDAKKTQTLYLRYSIRRTNLSNLLIPQLVGPEDTHERLSTVSASYTRDTRDKPLDAHRGMYESLDLAVNPSALGSNTNFGRGLGQVAYYRRVGGNDIVWANSLRLGMEFAFAGDHIPLSEKFFSGGGSTLRGFSLNGAGPQRDVPVCSNPSDPSTCAKITVPVGGAQLMILNSEIRFPIPVDFPIIGNKLGGVVFYDGGNVYNSVGFNNFFSNYSNTLGFGIRYATPVGPVRLDIGHNLNAPPGVKATQIFITLGQAF